MTDWSADERRALYHLEAWSRWMRQGVGRGMGWRSHCTDGARTTASRDLDEMAEIEDMRCAEICDAVVRSLVPAESAAIHHRYLRAAYRFPREPYEAALQRAIVNTGKGLYSRGVMHP